MKIIFSSAEYCLRVALHISWALQSCGHPAFEDRDQLYERVRNVRNSLITQGIPITVKVLFSDEVGDVVDLKVYLRDTMLLAPAGRKSWAELGEPIEKEKIKLVDDPDDELVLKKRMKHVRDNNWALVRRYAIHDAEITALYFQAVAKQYQEVTGETFVPSARSRVRSSALPAACAPAKSRRPSKAYRKSN